MDDTSHSLKPWVIFGGCVLVVVVLYWAQAVLVPIALAVLLTFVLTPPVSWLERWLGRVPAVLTAVTLVFIVLGLAGWGLARQMDHLADDLPTYRVNILAKIADVRGAGKGGSVEKLQETIEGIKTDLEQSSAPTGRSSRPIVVTSELVKGFPGFSWLGPIVGPVGTAGLVLAMVIFMLLERRDLRDRLIGLFGLGHLTVTTKAFDEAGTRVSRQLLMQSLVNLVYGIAAGIGLYVSRRPVPDGLGGARCGTPVHPVRRTGDWRRCADPRQPCRPPGLGRSALGGGPVRRARARHESRARNRPVCGCGGSLPGGAARVPGLLDVVVGTARPAHGDTADGVPRRAWQACTRSRIRRDADGRHARARPGVWLLSALAGPNQGEAADLIEQHIKTEAPRTVYDALLLPALNYAERDRIEQRLSLDEETAVIDATRELLSDAADLIRRLQPEPPPPDDSAVPGLREPLRVLGLATNGVADELALEMLGHLLNDLPIVVEITKGRMLASELVSLVQAQGVSVVCLADLPPSPPSKTRYLVKRLHAALPEVRILVGRWSPQALADDSTQLLRDAGATLVASTLTETRTYLSGLVETPRIPLPAVGVQAA